MECIDIIKFFAKEDPGISKKIVEEYQKGQSLADIARLMGRSKVYVIKRLRDLGIMSRPKHTQGNQVWRSSRGKQAARPYYGFTYFEGVIVIEPKEFPTLKIIHECWKEDKTIHEIVKELNRKRIPSRKGKLWSWAALQNIIKRFETEKIKIFEGDKYEYL